MRLLVIIFITATSCGNEKKVFLKVGDANYTIEDFKLYCPDRFNSKGQADSAWHNFLLKKLLVAEAKLRHLDFLPPLVEEVPIARRSEVIRIYYKLNVIDKTPLTDQDYNNAYEEIRTKVYFSQLVFDTKEHADTAYRMLLEGKPFDYLVRLFRNPKYYYGDMEYVPFHFLSDETRQELGKLNIGETSKPFKELRHWKIVYLKDRRKEDIKPLPEIMKYIKGGLKERKEKLYFKKMMAILWKKYEVQYNENVIPFLFKPPDSIPIEKYSTWLVRMENKEIKLGSIHNKLYTLFKTKGYDPRDVLDHEIENEIIYLEAIKANYDKKYEKEVNKVAEDLISSFLYKSLIYDSIVVTQSDVYSYMRENSIKDSVKARVFTKLNKMYQREKKVVKRLRNTIETDVDSSILSRLLLPKEEG